jgi:hypothetical protein
MSDMTLTYGDVVEIFGEGTEAGRDFLATMTEVNAMIENPEKFAGPRGLILAVKLAGLKTRIGAYANMLKTNQDKSILTRRRKDLLLSMERNLEENINALKLAGRLDGKAAGLL